MLDRFVELFWSMFSFLEDMGRIVVEGGYKTVRNGIQALRKTIYLFIATSVIAVVITGVLCFVIQGNSWVPWVAITYVIIMTWLLIGTHVALHTYRFLITVDVATEVLEAKAPMTAAKIKELIGENIPFEDLKELALLRVLYRLWFRLTLTCACVLFALCFMPIWRANMWLLGVLIFGLILMGFLFTDQAEKNSLVKVFRFLVVAVVIIIAAVLAFDDAALLFHRLIGKIPLGILIIVLLGYVFFGPVFESFKQAKGIVGFAAFLCILILGWGMWSDGTFGSWFNRASNSPYPVGTLPTTSNVVDDVVIFTGREKGGLILGQVPAHGRARIKYLDGSLVTNTENGWRSPVCGVPIKDTLPQWRNTPHVGDGMNTDAVYLELANGKFAAVSCSDNTAVIENNTRYEKEVRIKINDSRVWENEGNARFEFSIE